MNFRKMPMRPEKFKDDDANGGAISFVIKLFPQGLGQCIEVVE
jgi:hypothetical protein